MVQNLGRTKKVIKVGKVSGKYEILTVEENQISLIGNNTKRILEMNPKEIDVEVRRLKASKMRIINELKERRIIVRYS